MVPKTDPFMQEAKISRKSRHITAKMHTVLRTEGDPGHVKIAASVCTIHDSQMLQSSPEITCSPSIGLHPRSSACSTARCWFLMPPAGLDVSAIGRTLAGSQILPAVISRSIVDGPTCLVRLYPDSWSHGCRCCRCAGLMSSFPVGRDGLPISCPLCDASLHNAFAIFTPHIRYNLLNHLIHPYHGNRCHSRAAGGHPPPHWRHLDQPHQSP